MKFKDRIQYFLKKRALYHLLFWFAYIIIFAGFNPYSGILESFKRAAISMICIALPVYINLFFLIPKLLWRRRYSAYLVSIFLLSALGTVYLSIINLQLFAFISPTANLQIYFISAVHLLSVLFITSCLKLAKDWFVQQDTNKELEHEKLRTELAFLKSQVNPHFLFNTLNNLYALTLSKSDEAPEIILKLAAILRYMLYECNESRMYLNREIEYLKNYIELERIRLGGKGRIDLIIVGNTDRKEIAPLLFTPFLENAIKHGLNTIDGNPFIDMKLEVDNNNLDFSITNSKNSMLIKRMTKSSGIGLKNVQRRLELSYPGKHRLNIDEREETYTINLKLDLSS